MDVTAFRNRPDSPIAVALLVFALALAAWPSNSARSDETPVRTAGAATLAALAAAADFVGLVQVRDTDYLRRRDIPVSGSAYLAILIPYKGGHAADLIEAYEKGLRAFECYFPNPSVFEEGRRYLVFLRRDPENGDRFRGLPQGCAVEVLVRRDNRYAVRYPVDGLNLTVGQREALEESVQPLDFGDPYAIVDDESLAPSRRDALSAAGQIAPYAPEAPSRQWIYTQGIPLEEFRELLNLEPEL